MAAVMIGCQKVVHYEFRLFANIKKDVANDGLWQRLTSGVIVLIKIFSSSPKMLKLSFRTFLQCFTSYSRCSKAKHCRNVLGSVLGQKN
jgi:hypothetical protein